MARRKPVERWEEKEYFGDFRWRPYVPVAERRRQAEAELKRQQKKGVRFQPVQPEGRTIARSFWGKAWCDNLESYHDFANRLPRGRTYLRNGSVIDLRIESGKVSARVQGSSLYEVTVRIGALAAGNWESLKGRCAGHIDSMVALLAGRLPDTVMKAVTCRESGLFPKPSEIDLSCSCPDWAKMCKHVAAALYGIGTRLDSEPDLLFKLRGVSSGELIHAATRELTDATTAADGASDLAGEDLGALFGIDLAPPLQERPAGNGGGPSPKVRPSKTPASKQKGRAAKSSTTAQAGKAKAVKARIKAKPAARKKASKKVRKASSKR
jgi:uncharacterized Zn finger protein